ncbi:MAG: VCBS repeat-containing protein [Deltaproteobacteria bacterium]|nr:VCBS repeat-containing protein [Deltaproteobacteria bacterium]
MLHLGRALLLLIVIARATRADGAELQVVAVSPAPNAIAPATTLVRIDFDRPLDPTTVSADTVRVFGRGTGTAGGTRVLSNGDQTLTFTPTAPFSAGEIVLVNLSRALAGADGSPLRAAGWAFEITIATAPTTRSFTRIDTISNRSSPGVATRIYGAQATDLNHDGFLDLATVNEVSADVRVALNRGDGTGAFHAFLAPAPIALESSPNEPADFDNDGHTDGCFSAASGRAVTVLMGKGDGTYGTPRTIDLGGQPHGIAVLDVDGDADLDVVVADRQRSMLALLVNDGAGTFAAPAFFDGAVDGEYGLAAGDMNADGIVDLVVGGRDSRSIATLLGNGDGTFTAATPQDSGGNTWVVTLGDVNGDGHLDATTANSSSNNGAVLLGDGAGGFAAPVVTTTGAHTPSTDLGDLDGDGDLDWVLSVFGGGFWRVYLNDGHGAFTFERQIDAPSNPSCAVLFDFDDDGDLDLALTDEVADVILLERNGGSVKPTATPQCAATPRPCRTPAVAGKAALAISDAATAQRDAFAWSWTKGSATTVADFGDPATTDAFDLCVYDAGALVMSATAPPAGLCPKRPCWKPRKNGLDYADRARTPNGLQSITLRAGGTGKARIAVRAKGEHLTLPAPSGLAGPLEVQLQRPTGPCFGARYPTPFKKQSPKKLTAKSG